MPTVPRILSIAGTDPTGGAGLHADLKSIAAAGGYGMGVVTSLVAQNTTGVQSLHTPPADFLAAQLDSVLSDVTVDAIKIGMLGTVDNIRVVSEYLPRFRARWVVLDPVMIASSGDHLLDDDAESTLRDLCNLADVITPNLPELATLTCSDQALTLDEAINQASPFAESTSSNVIVKGGHLPGKDASNAVVTPDGRVFTVPSRRVNTTATHGTGCSLSSALATRLGAGDSLDDALAWSTGWLHEALEHGAALEVGHGHGPVDHGHRGRRLIQAALDAGEPDIV